jgi:P63C domain
LSPFLEGHHRPARVLCARHFLCQISPEDERLVEALRHPIRYREAGRSIAEGIPGTVLRRILSVWVRAHQAGVLGPSQERVAERAQILLNALADTAIDALIDEATGHQKRRAHDALQKLLAAYVRPEFRTYQSKFPISFYEQIHRVMGWPFDAASTARTAYIGKLTNKLIYEQLPPGVLEDLRNKNPVDPVTKRRKRKHFQHLTEDVGAPHVDKQINAVTTLLRATPNGQWKFFQMLFNQAFPPIQADLFLADEIERLKISGPNGEAAKLRRPETHNATKPNNAWWRCE